MDPNETLRLMLELANIDRVNRVEKYTDSMALGDSNAPELFEDYAQLSEYVRALHEWLAKGGFPPAAWPAPKIDVLHVHEGEYGEGGCSVEVFVNDQRTNIGYEDIDAGRGHEREEWNDRIDEHRDDNTAFGSMVFEALEGAARSSHISGEDSRRICHNCHKREGDFITDCTGDDTGRAQHDYRFPTDAQETGLV